MNIWAQPNTRKCKNNQKGVCSGNLDRSVTSKNLRINSSITDSYGFGLSVIVIAYAWRVCECACVRVPLWGVSFKQISIEHSSVGGPGPLEMAYSLWNHIANQDCQPIRMFLIFLEIHAQFRLTWTPTQTSEWGVIRWLWMFTSGEQLARMHSRAGVNRSDSAARFDKWLELFQI